MDLSSDLGCRWQQEPDAEVVGSYPSKNADQGAVAYQAWRADPKINKPVELVPKSLRCTYDDSEH
jgi:hypothetical protein